MDICFKYIIYFCLTLIFVRCEVVSEEEYETVIVAGEKIQVAKEDFPLQQRHNEAKDACKMLGNGWRLPNRNELETIRFQLVKKGRGNFKVNQRYMTTERVFYLNKDTLKMGGSRESWVRAVRPHPFIK